MQFQGEQLKIKYALEIFCKHLSILGRLLKVIGLAGFDTRLGHLFRVSSVGRAPHC